MLLVCESIALEPRVQVRFARFVEEVRRGV